ncbi:rab effector MyRIP isoform X2 [Haplochromis burtoni]|uniref:rab effector MyRIP isoform X2 n=1 Tax=Haplochromis burtoni TaxID=8153 RepID=UPI0006C9602B|nr:rab effector MyRIP isoform X2 [Haplochromis burtoni]
MGRKLDLTGLTDNEAEHVLQVVQRDMKLRKTEEERLSELKQELDEEGSRCLLLSRQSCFNQRCCIRCCSPFTFLLNPKRQCHDCHYNVCKACRVYNKRDKTWLCSACQKSRLLKTQSLEWFYTNVKKRFKRFGSAKVLKTLYRKHLAEHSALSELTEGSAYEESICNEDSVCGSDSTFYRQTEEHSMAETLTVARRVAEEAIDEAISKAEFDTSNQEKQNEARYLREHRGELIEELAKTIVQKIISRRKTLAEMRAEYDHDLALERNPDLHHQHQSPSDQASSSQKHQPSLWRSQSAFSLLDNDLPGLIEDSPQTLQKEGAGSAWKSVDRLDNAVLKSPDGNWIALQSAQLSRPSLLTKRKSLVYSALERESGVVSAYEGLGSDNESRPEPDSSWGAVLKEIHRKMTDSNFHLPDAGDSIPSPLTGERGSQDGLFSDSEGNWKPKKPLMALLKRKVPAEIIRPSSSHRTNIIDVNFNLEGAGGNQGETKVTKMRKSRKRRKSKKETVASSPVSDLNQNDNVPPHPSNDVTSDTLTSEATTPEPFDSEGNITVNKSNPVDEELQLSLQQQAARVSDSTTRNEKLDEDGDDGQTKKRTQESTDVEEEDERLWKMEIDLDERRMEDEEEKEMDEEMKYRFYRLVAQSRLSYFSSTEDNLDRSEVEWERENDEDMEEEDKEQDEKKPKGLTYKICQLEKQVRASQFSSTEDELDKVGIEEKEKGEEEDEDEEELVVKVCRLVNQVSASEFSSTEDELDRVSREGDETMDEESLWKLPAEEAAQLRDLVSLVRASQFSSTEDELDRIGENEGEMEEEMKQGETENSIEMEELWERADRERTETIGDLDVNMFELMADTEKTMREGRDGKVIHEDAFYNQIQVEAVQHEENERAENKDCTVERVTVDETIAKGHLGTEKVEVFKGNESENDSEKRQEINLKTGVEAQGSDLQQKNWLEAKWPDQDREDKFQKESKESEKKRQSLEDSDEEFDRIISSMLLMTLGDMDVEPIMDNVGGRNKELKDEDESSDQGGEKGEKVGQSTDASEETGHLSKESQSQRGHQRSESEVRKHPEENRSEETEGDISAKRENTDKAGRDVNEQKESEKSLVKEKPAALTFTKTFETSEATLMCERTEEDTEEKEDGRESLAAERQALETWGDTADMEKTDMKEVKDKSADIMEESSTLSLPEGLLSAEEIQNRYSAVSLRSITTEMLKVLNATEDLLQGVEGGENTPPPSTSLPPNTDPKKLDQQFSRLEENVYVAAGSVYSLEAELSDLEECARGICSSTSDMELSFLEEQVAAAAAKVQQSELQICDISARIAALKNAGLNVDTQSRLIKSRTIPVMPVTLDSSRQMRRRLPAPPVKEYKDK